MPPRWRLPSGNQKNGSRDRARPMMVRAAFGGGGDRRAVDDQAAELVELLALVPRGLGIEIEAEGRGQHRRSEVFGLFAARLRGHPIPVQLRDVSVHVRIRRGGQAQARMDVASELVGL